MIKVVAQITVRPSKSAIISSEKYENVKFQGEDENQKHPNNDNKNHFDLNLESKDPEALALWNHPVYKQNVKKNIVHKDFDLIDNVLIKQKHALAEEIAFILE